MNTPINDGGPAFPRTKSTGNLSNSTTEIVSVGGMSLRDWFAGQALAGLVPNGVLQLEVIKAQIKRPGQEAFSVGQCLARYTYDLADALLEARKLNTTSK